MKQSSPTILIVKYRALGDSIMGLSTISYLRSIYPNSKIYYAVRDWTANLYSNVDTDADDIISLSLNNFSDYLNTWKKVSKIKPDHIHELHLSGRTKKFFSIYSKIKGIKYTFHNHHLNTASEVFDHGKIKPLIQRDLDGAYSFLGKESEVPSYKSFVPKLNLNSPNKKQIVFGVVATRQTKMWPLEYFVKLANEIKALDSELSIVVPLSKSEGDIQIQNDLIKMDLSRNLEIVQKPLSELPEFISGSKLYIGNDTGLKHLAISVGVKSFTFFGPEPPLEWHPYDKEIHPYFYIDGLECRTKDAHYCGLSTCDSMVCLNQIDVSKVVEEIKEDLV